MRMWAARAQAAHVEQCQCAAAGVVGGCDATNGAAHCWRERLRPAAGDLRWEPTGPNMQRQVFDNSAACARSRRRAKVSETRGTTSAQATVCRMRLRVCAVGLVGYPPRCPAGSSRESIPPTPAQRTVPRKRPPAPRAAWRRARPSRHRATAQQQGFDCHPHVGNAIDFPKYSSLLTGIQPQKPISGWRARLRGSGPGHGVHIASATGHTRFWHRAKQCVQNHRRACNRGDMEACTCRAAAAQASSRPWSRPRSATARAVWAEGFWQLDDGHAEPARA